MSVHYFSNGTEGDIWFARWCDQCTHDGDCPHIRHMLLGEGDPVLSRDAEGELQCTAFERVGGQSNG